jgi:hypothetical protein
MIIPLTDLLSVFPAKTLTTAWVQFPPKLSRLSQYRHRITYRTECRVPSLAEWTVVHKNIAYSRENIRCLSRALDRFWFDFNLLNNHRSKLSNHQMIINDHHKHWTFSVKTLNFVMRIDNTLLRPFILSAFSKWVRLLQIAAHRDL